MINRFLVFLIVLVFVGCANTSTDSKQRNVEMAGVEQQDTSVVYALQKLYFRLKEGSVAERTVSLKEDQIQLGDTIIRLKIKVEYQGQKDRKYIFAANFMTSLVIPTGENTEIDNGVIGIGSDPQQAYKNCVQDWMNVFGNPLANLVNKKNAFSIDNMNVYAGLMGIRGSMPGNTWLKGDELMSRRIFGGIGQLVKSNKDKIVPVDIKLLVEKGKVVSGDCRLGNIVSFELLKKMKALPWPAAPQKFIFSQFYLVEKKGVE